MICILHHLGLGDQLMINGLVNHVSEHSHVYVVAKRCHKDTLEFMYRDHDNITMVYIDNISPQRIWNRIKSLNMNVLPLATYGAEDQLWKFMTHTGNPGTMFTNWAYGVYVQAGVNPLFMHTKFHVSRDLTREQELFDKLDLIDKDYIFVHDSGSGECKKIDVDKDDMLVVRPDMDVTNIFDYLTIMDRAKEIHCINSAFAWLVELTKIGLPHTNFLHVKNAHSYYDTKAVRTAFSHFTFL